MEWQGDLRHRWQLYSRRLGPFCLFRTQLFPCLAVLQYFRDVIRYYAGKGEKFVFIEIQCLSKVTDNLFAGWWQGAAFNLAEVGKVDIDFLGKLSKSQAGCFPEFS